MNNKDTRVQYTKKVLKDALISLLREKSITKISVKEICERAGINRGTFYLHYSAPNDLLMDIEQDFLTDKLRMFEPYMENADRSELGRLFEAIFRNHELSMILLGRHGSPQFQRRIKDLLRDKVLDGWQEEFPDYSRDDLNFVYEYTTTASVHMIAEWLEHSNMNADELAYRLDDLGHYCHLAIQEFHRR